MTITALPADTQGTRYNTQGQPINGFDNMDMGLTAVGNKPTALSNDSSGTVAVSHGAHDKIISMLPSGDLFDKNGKPTSYSLT